MSDYLYERAEKNGPTTENRSLLREAYSLGTSAINSACSEVAAHPTEYIAGAAALAGTGLLLYATRGRAARLAGSLAAPGEEAAVTLLRQGEKAAGARAISAEAPLLNAGMRGAETRLAGAVLERTTGEALAHEAGGFGLKRSVALPVIGMGGLVTLGIAGCSAPDSQDKEKEKEKDRGDKPIDIFGTTNGTSRYTDNPSDSNPVTTSGYDSPTAPHSSPTTNTWFWYWMMTRNSGSSSGAGRGTTSESHTSGSASESHTSGSAHSESVHGTSSAHAEGGSHGSFGHGTSGHASSGS